MTRVNRKRWGLPAMALSVIAMAGCAVTQPGAAGSPGSAEPAPNRFFVTALAQSSQYVIEGPAMVTFAEAKGGFSIGRATQAGPQYVGPLSGPLFGPFFIPDGYFLVPLGTELAVYSGLCYKAPTCLRSMSAAPSGQ